MRRSHSVLSFCLTLLPLVTFAARSGEASRRLSDVRTSVCPSDSSLTGHLDVASFVQDMEDGATEFLLCPDVEYNELLTLPSTQSVIDIRCLDPEDYCVWEISEGSHLIIEEGLSVTAKGILFKGATNSSIRVKQGPLVQLSGCEWENNGGFAVIEILNDTLAENNGFSSEEFTAQIEITECTFSNNTVEGAIVFNDIANLRVEKVRFDGNVANGPIVDLQQGFHQMHSLGFENNTATGTGMIYLSGNARLNQSGICGSGNSAGPVCNGTFLQVGNPDECSIDNQIQCSPACFDYLPCVDQSCVGTLDGLQAALIDGGAIQLCSDNTISLDDLNEPLEIAESAVAMTCVSNCTIDGGNVQFRIVDGATEVRFDGVVFSGSEEMSIQLDVDPTAPSAIVFQNCDWRNHRGDHVVLAAPEGDLEEDETIEAAVRILGSRFMDNDVSNFVVENRALELQIEGCSFRRNACQGIVGGIGGLNQINDSTFRNNEALNTVLGVGIDSRGFIVEDSCGINNTDSNACNGTLYEAADPAQCREDSDDEDACSVICSPLESCGSVLPDCVSSYAGLRTTLQISPGGIVVVCPNTVMQVDSEDEVIEISEAGTVITCGGDGFRSSNCTIVGGPSHLVINTTTVNVTGMTFLESTTFSVRVVVDPTIESSVSFSDCQWENNTGLETFEITSSLAAGTLTRSRYLQDESTMTSLAEVTISNSSFVRNSVSSNTISNEGSNLIILQSEFLNNRPGGSAVRLDSGKARMEDVQFLGNTVNLGVIYVNLGASISRSDDAPICGLNNTSEQIPCDGIFLQTIDSEDCLDGNLDACRAGCSSLEPCGQKEEGCHSEWSSLTNSVESSGGGDTFVICPGAELVLSADDVPLVLDKNDTILRCGDDGKRDNRCVVFGGEHQLVINGTVQGIQIEGVTFLGSTNVSVTAMGDSSSTASFTDCEFSGHKGDAVILVLSFLETQRWLLLGEDGEAPASKSMFVAIDSGLFDDNLVAFSPVLNVQGDVNVSRTAFNGNNGTEGSGAISALYQAGLMVYDSCFVRNRGNVSGSILLWQSAADSFVQEDNFGDDNIAEIGNCSDILRVGDPVSCDDFDALTCSLESQSSPAPTQLLSSEPSLETPTASPAPSSGMTGSPESPTAAPTVSRSCFNASRWEILFESVRESDGEEVFTICPNTTINMTEMEADDLAPLLIRASGVTIQCGSRRQGSCVLSGGTNHILLRRSVEDVKLRYITMERASGASVAGTPRTPFSVEFENCFWTNNTGGSTIKIEAEATGNDDIVSARELQNVDDNFFVCDRCIFAQNTASGSILDASGTTLILEATNFRNNEAGQSVIAVEEGSLLLRESCIIGSESSSAALVSSVDADIVTSDVFLQGNGGSSCPGYFDEDGNCVQADASTSCIASEKRCYSHWADLSAALSQLPDDGSESKITICANSVLAVADFAPIKISRSKTTIRCGQNGASDNNCLVTGGGVQFEIVGSTVDVIFSGITFAQSTIAAIHAAGGRSARSQVVDCIFNNIDTGEAAVLIYDGELPSSTQGRRKLGIDDYTEPSDRSMTVEIAYCTFSNINVELAPVATLKGTIVVEDSKFESNAGVAGGIGEWFSGSIALSNSCFTSSTGQSAGGVYIDGDSATEDNNFSDDNDSVDGDCTDMFLAKATESDGGPEGLCVPFSATECGARTTPTSSPTSAPTLPSQPDSGATPPPSRTPIDCIGTWDDLKGAVASVDGSGVENVFTLCPDAVLQAGDDPILLNQENGNILIECGLNGRLRDNCVVSGGRAHFRISGAAIEVSFRGIRLAGSSEVSILAGADKESSVRFDECEWVDNTGLFAVLVYNEAEEEFNVQTPILDLTASGDSMSASFEDCLFSENLVTQATVSSVGGAISFRSTAFEKHSELSTGVIVASGEALVSVSNCCFVENDSNLPGSIFLREQSELTLNEDNFGYDNRVMLIQSCTDIFSLAADEDCGSSSCPGICSTFDGSGCNIRGYEYDAPSSAPSDRPVGVPTPGNAPSSPGGTIFAFEETTLFGSGFFLRNLVVAAIVAVFGFASFFYCKSQQSKEPSSKAMESAPVAESNSLHDQVGDDMDAPSSVMEPSSMGFHPGGAEVYADEVVLDPDTIAPKKKPKGGGFFGRKSKKQDEEPAVDELAPMVADGMNVSPSFRMASGRFDDDGIELS